MIFDDREDNYRIALDLDEPVSRDAVLAAAAAGWKLEQLALDCSVSVDEARLRCAEEGVTLPRLWTHPTPHPSRAATWAAMGLVVHEGMTMLDAAARVGANRRTVRHALNGLGLAPGRNGHNATRKAADKARRKALARKLAKCQREGMTCLAAAASLGVGYNTALRASQAHGIVWHTVADRGALYDALEAENAKPPRERAMRPQIAARVGCTVGAVHDALHSLGWRWKDERAAALRDEIRSFAAAHPDATPAQIARRCSCDVRAVHRALK